jgi:hypothetical protein
MSYAGLFLTDTYYRYLGIKYFSMPRFKLYIRNIYCVTVTDGGAEGEQDELYLWVTSQRLGWPPVRIELGDFSEHSGRVYDRWLYDGEVQLVDEHYFSFIDSDVFNSDDYIGGFALRRNAGPRLFSNTNWAETDGSDYLFVEFKGEGANYSMAFKYEVA